MYVKRELLEDLDITFAGWLSDRDPHSFEFREYNPSPSAKRFEPGTPSFADAIVARESLGFILKIGMNNIEERDLNLVRYLRKRLEDLPNIEFMTPRNNRAQILTFKLEGQDTKALFEYLLEKNIFVSYRQGGIRVSPHFYNNQSDIDRFVDTVEEYFKRANVET